MSHSHSHSDIPPKAHAFPLSVIHDHIFLLHRLLPFLLRRICRPISIFPFISWNSKVDCHVHKNLPLLCILCQVNLIHILVSYLFEINCNIIYPYMYIYTYTCVYVCVCVCVDVRRFMIILCVCFFCPMLPTCLAYFVHIGTVKRLIISVKKINSLHPCAVTRNLMYK
jgi:hypothetical protein